MPKPPSIPVISLDIYRGTLNNRSAKNPGTVADSITFSVAGAKGGVGKTTTSLNLAAALAEVDDTAVIEFDLAMANTVDFLDIDCSPDVDPTLHDVLSDTARVTTATYEAPGGFDVVPSGSTLDGYAETDPDNLDQVVSALTSSYEFVVIDVGAGLSRETLLPLGVADETVLVSTPRVASVRDAEKTKGLVERVGGSVTGVVFVKSGTGTAPEPDRIASFLEIDLLGHVPDDSAVPASQDAGRPVVTHAPNSPAARAYVDIAERLLDRSPPRGGTVSEERQPDRGRT